MKKFNFLKELEISETKDIQITDETDIDRHPTVWIPLGMCLGSALGSSFGLMLNNILLGMGLGVSLGLLAGIAIYAVKSKENK